MSTSFSRRQWMRAVNNRYLKVVGKYPEWMASVESEVERRVRQRVSRGTVTVSIRVRRLPRPEDFQINQVALTSYLQQLDAVSQRLKIEGPRDLAHLLALPGVVVEQTEAALPEDSVYTLVFRLLESALTRSRSSGSPKDGRWGLNSTGTMVRSPASWARSSNWPRSR